MSVFRLNVDTAQDNTLVVDIVTSHEAKVYFVRVHNTCTNTLRVCKSKTKRLTLRDITPGNTYDVSGGIVRRGKLVYLGKRTSITPPQHVKFSDIQAHDTMNDKDTHTAATQPSSNVTLYTMDEFDAFAKTLLSSSNASVGYHEPTCTFVVRYKDTL